MIKDHRDQLDIQQSIKQSRKNPTLSTAKTDSSTVDAPNPNDYIISIKQR